MQSNLRSLIDSRGKTTPPRFRQFRRSKRIGIKHSEIRALDLFAGAGGSSLGARQAAVLIVAAVDNWDRAEATYLDNFSGVKFYRCKCESLDPQRIKREVGPIDLLIASPECTSHSCAKGAADRSETSRKTANQVTRFARALKPRWIVVENVVHMRTWSGYLRWYRRLQRLGYKIRVQTLNSSDFGVPQSRKRLFIMCDRKRYPPRVIAPKPKARRSAREVITMNGTHEYSLLRTPSRAEPTLERADRAIRLLGRGVEFLLVYYGTDGAGGWQRLDVPLRTVTTLDRFAYVRRNGRRRYEMRMLQVPELRKAMGFPSAFKMRHGTRRDKIKLLGNAVCPRVMRAAILTLLGETSDPRLHPIRNG